jgi:hypothetical protein
MRKMPRSEIGMQLAKEREEQRLADMKEEHDARAKEEHESSIGYLIAKEEEEERLARLKQDEIQSETAKRTISQRALVQRINRKLAPQNQHLERNRSAAALDYSGLYCVIEGGKRGAHWRSRTLVRDHVDLEALGRELGVLASGETVSTGDGS